MTVIDALFVTCVVLIISLWITNSLFGSSPSQKSENLTITTFNPDEGDRLIVMSNKPFTPIYARYLIKQIKDAFDCDSPILIFDKDLKVQVIKGGFNLPTIRYVTLAEGGIVTRPTFAMIGERGPEVVRPLPRLNVEATGE